MEGTDPGSDLMTVKVYTVDSVIKMSLTATLIPLSWAAMVCKTISILFPCNLTPVLTGPPKFNPLTTMILSGDRNWDPCRLD